MARNFQDSVAWRAALRLVVAINRAHKRAPWRKDREFVSSFRGAALALGERIARAHRWGDFATELAEYRSALGELRVVEGSLEYVRVIHPSEAAFVSEIHAICDECAHELGKLIEECQVGVHAQRQRERPDRS